MRTSKLALRSSAAISFRAGRFRDIGEGMGLLSAVTRYITQSGQWRGSWCSLQAAIVRLFYIVEGSCQLTVIHSTILSVRVSISTGVHLVCLATPWVVLKLEPANRFLFGPRIDPASSCFVIH